MLYKLAESEKKVEKHLAVNEKCSTFALAKKKQGRSASSTE